MQRLFGRFSIMEKHFDKWPAFSWRFVAGISPAESGVLDCVAFFRVGDHSGGRREIGFYIAFEVQREFRIGDEVGEPVSWAALAGDDDLAINVVEPDLDSPWCARSSTDRGDVDHDIPALKRVFYAVVHCVKAFAVAVGGLAHSTAFK